MNRKRKERLTQQVRDKIFMKQLGKELREQETDYQAEPRFWSIMDYKYVPTADGCGERIAVYDNEGNMYYDVEEFIKDYLEYQETDSLLDKHGRESLGEFLQVDDLYEAYEYVKDNFDDDEWNSAEEEKISYIKENTMFLTKEEAKEHLRSNSHHYTKDAHTYAMTAWRAPKVGRLLKILEENK